MRLNGVGESLDKIAAHPGMPEEEVRELVHVMGDKEVVDWCVCDTDNDGAISFPHIEKHALIVIDEAHECWPTNRANLPERAANFFAKHAHISLDMVIISQDCKDLHRLIIRRMAKKNTYTKLDALGSDQRYSVRFYAATGTGKYETVGTEVRKYDPAIWELYHGVQPGIESNEVYKGNTRTLWKTLRGPSIVMGLALVIGVVMFLRFFFANGSTGEESKLKEVVKTQKAAIRAIAHAPGAQPATVVTKVVETPKTKEKLPAGVQYILDMAANARARHAGWYGQRDIVEFRASGGGQVLDRFTTEQPWALGWSVKRTEFGVLLSAKGHEIIATYRHDLARGPVWRAVRCYDRAHKGCGGVACDERERDTADHRRGERKHLDHSWQAPAGHVPGDASVSGKLLNCASNAQGTGMSLTVRKCQKSLFPH